MCICPAVEMCCASERWPACVQWHLFYQTEVWSWNTEIHQSSLTFCSSRLLHTSKPDPDPVWTLPLFQELLQDQAHLRLHLLQNTQTSYHDYHHHPAIIMTCLTLNVSVCGQYRAECWWGPPPLLSPLWPSEAPAGRCRRARLPPQPGNQPRQRRIFSGLSLAAPWTARRCSHRTSAEPCCAQTVCWTFTLLPAS